MRVRVGERRQRLRRVSEEWRGEWAVGEWWPRAEAAVAERRRGLGSAGPATAARTAVPTELESRALRKLVTNVPRPLLHCGLTLARPHLALQPPPKPLSTLTCPPTRNDHDTGH